VVQREITRNIQTLSIALATWRVSLLPVSRPDCMVLYVSHSSTCNWSFLASKCDENLSTNSEQCCRQSARVTQTRSQRHILGQSLLTYLLTYIISSPW